MSNGGSDTKNQTLYVVLLLILATSVLLLSYVLFSFLPDRRVVINNQQIDVIVADTSKERERGLSGRERLSDREGMLFVFTDGDEYCFWMKDMNFPIDIVWLNSSKEVIDIAKDVKPDSYPKTFCPNQKAKYVIEVNSGKADEWGISTGDRADF